MKAKTLHKLNLTEFAVFKRCHPPGLLFKLPFFFFVPTIFINFLHKKKRTWRIYLSTWTQAHVEGRHLKVL